MNNQQYVAHKLQQIDLKNNSLLVISFPKSTPLSTVHQVMTVYGAELNNISGNYSVIVAYDGSQTISHFNEEQMNQLGWFRSSGNSVASGTKSESKVDNVVPLQSRKPIS